MLRDLLRVLKKYNITERERQILTKAILFHDAVYDPHQDNNEELSCQAFLKHYSNDRDKDQVCQLIMATKTHQANNKLEQIIIELDLNIFNKPMNELIEFEHGIFKEYQFVSIDEYINARIDFLKSLDCNSGIQLIKYVASRSYKIGIYPGSFNPFHIGHLNIVQKAESVFDKVIIARLTNPEKEKSYFELPNLQNEIIEYDGIVTDLFTSRNNIEFYFVRGLRSVHDIGYEENLRKYVHDIKPSIKFVYFFCDSGLEHISSSQIRNLMKFDKQLAYKYIPNEISKNPNFESKRR